MKIRRDLFQVAAGARDEGGHKMEPEEQPTARVIATDAPATLGGMDIGKSLRAEVVAYSSAGEVGLARASACSNCRYFDRTWWLNTVANAEMGTDEERHAINQIRGEVLLHGLASLGDDGDADVEAAIRDWGKCHALSEHQKDLVVVHPTASCPGEVRGPSMPLGFYKPKSTEAEKAGVSARDNLLHQAQGKT